MIFIFSSKSPFFPSYFTLKYFTLHVLLIQYAKQELYTLEYILIWKNGGFTWLVKTRAELYFTFILAYKDAYTMPEIILKLYREKRLSWQLTQLEEPILLHPRSPSRKHVTQPIRINCILYKLLHLQKRDELLCYEQNGLYLDTNSSRGKK